MTNDKRRFDPLYWCWVILGLGGLAAGWWGFHDSHTKSIAIEKSESRIEQLEKTNDLQASTITQYQQNFKILEAEFYSDQMSLRISRQIATDYKKERDVNWERYQHAQQLYEQCRR